MSTPLVPYKFSGSNTYTSLLDGSTVTIDPETNTALLGWWACHLSGETTTTANERMAAAVGQSAQIGRVYDGTPETGYTEGVDSLLGGAEQFGLGSNPLVISYSHTSTSAIASGSLSSIATAVQDSLATFSESATSADTEIFACLSHENDHKSNAGSYTDAEWYSAVETFKGWIDDLDNPYVHSTMIMVRCDTDSKLSTYWSHVSDYIDSVWFDPYMNYLLAGSSDTPTITWLPMITNITDVTGLPSDMIGVAETGILPTASSTNQGNYLTGMDVALPYLRGICYFDGPGSLGCTQISVNSTLAHDYGGLWTP